MLHDGSTFEHKGRAFRVEFPHDDSHDAPWKENDGHGIVSEWTTRDKKPGERLLCSDRHSKRYYDIAESTKIAKRDGWDAAPYGGKAGEKAARAVEADFEYLRRWCNDQWSYVGVVVHFIDSDNEVTDESASLWGIESDAHKYLEATAHELADEICERLDDDMATSIAASRPDMQPGFAGA